MPILRFQATKMSEANVSHISLVERGANRIPFKVIKEESALMSKFSGLDLGNLFARKAEKTPEIPMIIGVVTMKGDSLETVQASIAEAGFAVDSMVEMEDGSVVFKQEGFSDEALADGVVVRLSESVALVTKGFSPYNMDIVADGITFADQCAASGFYPAINIIMNTLAESIRTVTYNAKTPSEAKSAVAKLFAEASAYTGSFVGALPVKAFKMEELASAIPLVVEKACKPKPGADGAMDDESAETDPLKKEAAKAKKDDEGAENPGDDAQGAAPVVTSEEPAKKAEGSEEGAAPVAAVLTEDRVADMVATKVSEATTELATKFEQLIASMEEVQKSVQGFEATASDLKTRTEKAEQLAADSVKAVKGVVVVGSGASDDAEPVAKTQKSELRGDTDTAFLPRRPFPSKNR